MLRLLVPAERARSAPLIAQALPVTLSLCVGAAILWLIGGVFVGTLSGLKPGSFIDRAGMTGALAAVSLPIFFTGPILLLIFVYTLGWLPEQRGTCRSRGIRCSGS